MMGCVFVRVNPSKGAGVARGKLPAVGRKVLLFLNETFLSDNGKIAAAASALGQYGTSYNHIQTSPIAIHCLNVVPQQNIVNIIVPTVRAYLYNYTSKM